MTAAQQEKQIEAIVERKLLEFLGDPDEGLKLRPSFVAKLRKSMKDGRKSIPQSVVMKRHGLRWVEADGAWGARATRPGRARQDCH